MSGRQEWFSARELAEIAKERGLTAYPFDKGSFNRLAQKLKWNDVAELARKRAGRGGGMEYHYSLLPMDLQDVIYSIEAQQVELKQQSRDEALDIALLEAIKETGMPERAIGAREARAAITRQIDFYAAQHRQSRAWAIKEFMKAQELHLLRDEALVKIQDGIGLTPSQSKSIQGPDALKFGFAIDPSLIITANARPRGISKISRSTLYEWFKARDEKSVIALAPVPTKVSSDIPAGFEHFLKFYAIGTKPDASEALRDYLKTDPPEHLRLTINQVRYTLKNKLNDVERNVGREGLLTLRSRLPYVTRKTENLFPTTIYVADGKTFDAEVADAVSRLPIRPEITSVMDVATRKCVSIAISRKENFVAVSEALRRACETNGIPAMFYTDRGAGYKNKSVDADHSGLMARLSITKMHALPYNSQAKGNVERFNRTCWNPLAKKFPTYIGEDMDKEAGQWAHKKSRREIKEFGSSKLLMPWDEFLQVCDRAVEDYNNAPHSGLPRFEDPETGSLRHMSPNEAWDAHVKDGFEAIYPEADEIDDLFRPYVARVANRGLVAWNTNTFFHDDLLAYNGKKVLVGYDDHQADRVWVREMLEDEAPGRLICVAVFDGNSTHYIPLTAQKKAEEKRQAGRLDRIDKKRLDVVAEIRTPFITAQPAPEPAPFLQVVPQEISPEPAEAAIAAPTRLVFRSDAELAKWVLEHPDEAKPKQIALLRDCLNRPMTVDSLRMSGVDLDALQRFLRTAA